MSKPDTKVDNANIQELQSKNDALKQKNDEMLNMNSNLTM